MKTTIIREIGIWSVRLALSGGIIYGGAIKNLDLMIVCAGGLFLSWLFE
jgi:hypothetical protein